MILNWSSELGYIGLQPLVRVWATGAGAALPPANECGDITYDQILASDRTGNGPQLLTWTIPPPTSHTATGAPGQVAWDSAGNLYFCFALNQWARIGPGGYSNVF